MFIAVIFVETYKIDINVCLCQKTNDRFLKGRKIIVFNNKFETIIRLKNHKTPDNLTNSLY